MKTIISLIIMGLSVLMSQAQVVVYNEAKASQFEKKLVSTAIEVSDTFGPDYEVKNAGKVEISGPLVFQDTDMRPEIQKHVGRTYYDVTFFPQDPSSIIYSRLSTVSILSDGTPLFVIFGNSYGVNFFFRSFEEQKKHPSFTVPMEKDRKVEKIL